MVSAQDVRVEGVLVVELTSADVAGERITVAVAAHVDRVENLVVEGDAAVLAPRRRRHFRSVILGRIRRLQRPPVGVPFGVRARLVFFESGTAQVDDDVIILRRWTTSTTMTMMTTSSERSEFVLRRGRRRRRRRRRGMRKNQFALDGDVGRLNGRSERGGSGGCGRDGRDDDLMTVRRRRISKFFETVSGKRRRRRRWRRVDVFDRVSSAMTDFNRMQRRQRWRRRRRRTSIDVDCDAPVTGDCADGRRRSRQSDGAGGDGGDGGGDASAETFVWNESEQRLRVVRVLESARNLRSSFIFDSAFF